MNLTCLFREVIGFVGDITERKRVKDGKYQIFKFVLTNGHLRLRVIIWGQALIDQYEREIMPSRV